MRDQKAGRPRNDTINKILTVLVVMLSVSQIVMIPLAFHLSSSSSSSSEPRSNVGIPRPPSKRRQVSPRRAVDAGRLPPGAAGTLNGYPIYYRDNQTVHSSVSCVGENYRPNAWMHRSCQFRHLCFHLKTKEFLLYQSPEERAQAEALKEFAYASTSLNTSVAIGGINIKRDVNKKITSMKWFPRIVQGSLTEPYYELDDRVVW